MQKHKHVEENKHQTFPTQLATTEALLEKFKRDDGKHGQWRATTMLTALAKLGTLAHGNHERLQKAKETMDATYRAVFSDGNSDGEKRKILLELLNLQFKILFELQSYAMARKLVINTTMSNFPAMESFPQSAVATFEYYAGRLALLEGRPIRALELLKSSYARIRGKKSPLLRPSDYANMTKLTKLMCFAHLGLGFAPSSPLPTSFFTAICQAVSQGNVVRLNSLLQEHQKSICALGGFLMLSRLKLVARARLVRLCVMVYRSTPPNLADANKIPLSFFYPAFARWDEVHTEIDNHARCALTMLISTGLVRGYVSFDKDTLVLSSKEPFPKTSESFNKDCVVE